MANLVITFGGIFFMIALLPTIFSDDKPSIWTSIPTAIILLSFSLVYYDLGLYSAAIISLLTSTLWYVIAIQTGERKNGKIKEKADAKIRSAKERFRLFKR